MFNLQTDGAADGSHIIADLHVPDCRQPARMVPLGIQLQRLGMLNILQQLGFLFNRGLLTVLDGLGPLHHLGSLVADKTAVRP